MTPPVSHRPLHNNLDVGKVRHQQGLQARLIEDLEMVGRFVPKPFGPAEPTWAASDNLAQNGISTLRGEVSKRAVPDNNVIGLSGERVGHGIEQEVVRPRVHLTSVGDSRWFDVGAVHVWTEETGREEPIAAPDVEHRVSGFDQRPGIESPVEDQRVACAAEKSPCVVAMVEKVRMLPTPLTAKQHLEVEVTKKGQEPIHGSQPSPCARMMDDASRA